MKRNNNRQAGFAIGIVAVVIAIFLVFTTVLGVFAAVKVAAYSPVGSAVSWATGGTSPDTGQRADYEASNVIEDGYINLNVPLVRQYDGGKCGRTSVAMVANYFGASFVPDDCAAGVNDNLLPSASKSTILPRYSDKSWKKSRITASGSNWDKVFTSLSKGNPVIFFQKKWFNTNCSRTNSSNGHIIVIRGWDKEKGELIINSPHTQKSITCNVPKSIYNSASNLSHKYGSGVIIYSLE